MLSRLWWAVCAVLLAGIVLLPLAQVLLRDLFNSPLVGAEEFTRFLLVCLVFASYPLVIAHGDNIRMDELHHALRGRWRRCLDVVMAVGTASASGFVSWATLMTIFSNLNNTTPTLKIPFWIFLASTLIGFACACVVHLLTLRCRQHPRAEHNKPELHQ